MNPAALHAHVQVAEWMDVFISLGCVPAVGLLGHRIDIGSASVGTAKQFYRVYVLIYSPSTVLLLQFLNPHQYWICFVTGS